MKIFLVTIYLIYQLILINLFFIQMMKLIMNFLNIIITMMIMKIKYLSINLIEKKKDMNFLILKIMKLHIYILYLVLMKKKI